MLWSVFDVLKTRQLSGSWTLIVLVFFIYFQLLHTPKAYETASFIYNMPHIRGLEYCILSNNTHQKMFCFLSYALYSWEKKSTR